MTDNPTPTVTAKRLDAHDRAYWLELTDQQREDACRLIDAAGLDPNATRAIEFDVIDCPLLRFEIVLRDDLGRIKLTHDHQDGPLCDDCEIAYLTVERPALSLPSWWKPDLIGEGV